ncbi:MAG TPA: hypothetical protein VJ142_02655 [Candidatus Nanoarchaeia archaeon]|nr:hypothetical protein [Candidatus Nanoarchaeia archaeon]
MAKGLKEKIRKTKPKVKRFVNILLGVAIFVALMGSAFSLSILFGIVFVIGFALSIYSGDLKKKPWKPIAIFVGALVIRFALDQYLNPLLASKTFLDLSVSALIFLSILIFGWRIKRS